MWAESFQSFEGVHLDELKGVILLRPIVDAYNLETSTVIAHCGTTGSTEEIKNF